jgi:acyl-coenzyme A synthetase/AMP-(fatty) acid ligase
VASERQDGQWTFVNPRLEARRPAAASPAAPAQAHRALGMTEMLGPLTNERALHALPAHKPWSSGRAVPGMDLLLRDPVTGKRRTQGEGELLVRGSASMAGLYKRESGETFTADGYYPTGDLVRIDSEGHVFFVRRLGDMIKVRGANVAPAEVENVLARLPGVAEAAVFLLGHGDRPRLAAAVVPIRGHAPEPEAWHRSLRESLSSFKVPEAIYVTSADELPRTGSGKVKRSALSTWATERPAWQPQAMPEPQRPHP